MVRLSLKWIYKIAYCGKRIRFTCGLICWSKSVGIEGAFIVCPNSVFCFHKINLFVILQDLFIHAGNLMICWTPISRNFPTKQHLYWTIEKWQCSCRQTNPCAISQLVTLLASRKTSPCSNGYVSKKATCRWLTKIQPYLILLSTYFIWVKVEPHLHGSTDDRVPDLLKIMLKIVTFSIVCLQLVEKHIIHSCSNPNSGECNKDNVYHSGILSDLAIKEDSQPIQAMEGLISPTIFNNECRCICLKYITVGNIFIFTIQKTLFGKEHRKLSEKEVI